jgi:hypothetical protein
MSWKNVEQEKCMMAPTFYGFTVYLARRRKWRLNDFLGWAKVNTLSR